MRFVDVRILKQGKQNSQTLTVHIHTMQHHETHASLKFNQNNLNLILQKAGTANLASVPFYDILYAFSS